MDFDHFYKNQTLINNLLFWLFYNVFKVEALNRINK